ncbi:MAG: glycosyltransferase [Prolixibacteraceae bacterium]
MNQILPQGKFRKKTLALTVTNDLVTDNRVHKIAGTLKDMGYDVCLIGRILDNSPELAHRAYTTHRFNLWFNQGPLFYADYNIRLFFYLLIKNFDVVVANDLDTLLACFVHTEITKKPLVYDSHEYFTEVPELVNRPWVQRQWEKIEEGIVPKLKHCYTVCQSIADIYQQKYGTNFKVVRNLPHLKVAPTTDNYQPPFPIDLPVILYQGAVNVGRGIQEAILAMHQISDARLVIIGDGDEMEEIQKLVKTEKLDDKVVITGRIPLETLHNITPFASIGLSVEKDIGLNYRYALPNKLFDYIQSEVPVLASQLPEIKAVVEGNKVGMTITATTPEQIAQGVNRMLSAPHLMQEWKENCKIASTELCWEKEEKILHSIYQPFL